MPTKLQLKLVKGTDPTSGKTLYTTETISNIRTAATDENLRFSAMEIAALLDLPIDSIVRTNAGTLVEGVKKEALIVRSGRFAWNDTIDQLAESQESDRAILDPASVAAPCVHRHDVILALRRTNPAWAQTAHLRPATKVGEVRGGSGGQHARPHHNEEVVLVAALRADATLGDGMRRSRNRDAGQVRNG